MKEEGKYLCGVCGKAFGNITEKLRHEGRCRKEKRDERLDCLPDERSRGSPDESDEEVDGDFPPFGSLPAEEGLGDDSRMANLCGDNTRPLRLRRG